MIKVVIALVPLIFSINSFSQSSIIHYNDPFNDYLKTISFKIGTGIIIPKNKNYIKASPLIDLSVDFPLKRKKSIEFSIQFAIPNSKQDFTYIRDTDTIRAKSTSIINGLVRFKKEVLNTEKIKSNIGLGIGISGITTDARNQNLQKKENASKYETISTILITPGIELIKRFKNKDEFTLSFNIQYSPYKIEGALKENIGSIFFLPKIAYKF